MFSRCSIGLPGQLCLIFHSGQLTSTSMSFTLHTEPDVSPPEFTLTCRSEGGPATTVAWERNGDTLGEGDNMIETSQVIVKFTRNTVYENRLRVRGREEGSYRCTVSNDFGHDSLASTQIMISGIWNINKCIFAIANVKV